jgi:ClpP class serine protease
MIRAFKYERRGLLAIDPKAFFEVFCFGSEPRENLEMGEAMIVDVRGPLEQHAHSFWDSYEDIERRVAAACARSCRAVILRFDSPGGEAAGCFETADNVRALCDAAGKQLHAFAEGDCCSAAYAIASRAQSITIGNAALMGSIGVLSCRDDYSQQNAQRGVRVALIASGARKADGHPDQPLSEAEIANTQAIVDSMGGVFFELVARGRGLTPEGVSQLEAKVFHGATAVAAGLADQVGSLKTVLAMVAGFSSGDNMADKKEEPKASPYETARAALEEAAKGDDANAEAAKRALAAMEPPAPADDKDKKPESAESAPAPESKPDDEKTATAAAAWREAIAAQKRVADLEAKQAKRDEQDERAKLLARADLAPAMRTLLEKAPIELVRETIKDMGEDKTPPAAAAASRLGIAAVRQPVTGDKQDTGAPQLPPAERAVLDARMGLTAETSGVQNTEYKLVLGVQGKPAATTPVAAPAATPAAKPAA